MLNTELIQELKETLLRRQKELKEEIEQAKINSKPVELDQQAVGRVSRIDAIQQQQMHLSSLQRMETQLTLINEALGRIDSEDYGYCRICEEPIEMKRLKAKPEAPLCLNCAQGRKFE